MRKGHKEESEREEAGIDFSGRNEEKQETATSPRASSDTQTHTCENTPACTHFADSA